MKKMTLLLCLLSSAFVSSAEVYTYRQPNGSFLYSDIPIPGRVDIHGRKSVGHTPTPTIVGSDDTAGGKEQTIDEKNAETVKKNQKINEDNKKAAEQAKIAQAEQEKRIAETNAANCVTAKANLQAANSGNYANKAERIATAQKSVGLYCK